MRRVRSRLLLMLLLVSAADARAQIFADRTFAFDPLGDRTGDTLGFTWLGQSRLAAEFSRYGGGSPDHRWNAKLGGAAEFVRWDSTASIGMVGTMEVVVDPNNDIAFNPRAIFWEEGVIASFRIGPGESIQAGYMHRCKHDIDNLEMYPTFEQRTLIYGSFVTRVNWRPRLLLDGDLPLAVSGSVRNDLFLILLDDRILADTRGVGRDLETLADAITLTGRIRIRPSASFGAHLTASWMASAYGTGEGLGGRFSGMTILGSMPMLELGIDLINPRGATFTLFARGEWQRDAGIVMIPRAASLVMVGIRVADATAGG